MNFIPIFNELLYYIFSIIEYSVTVMWDITVKYGLNPYYAYKQFITPSKSFLLFYYNLNKNIYINIFMILLPVAAIYILYKNSFEIPYKFSKLIIKFLSAFIIFWNAHDISYIFLKISYVFYNYIYSMNHNWYGLMYDNIDIKSKFISLFFSGSMFFAISILFGILIMRQAIIIFFTLVFPLISIFLIFPDSEKYVFKFIRMFFEVIFFQFFTIMMLYTLTIFSRDPFLEIGIIYASAIVPLYFVTEMFQLFRANTMFPFFGLSFDTGMAGNLDMGNLLNSSLPIDQNLSGGVYDSEGIKY